MAGFDRSKWKAAPLTTVNATVNETKKFDTYFESGNNEYARFWTNRDGITVKRVLPAHEPGDSPYVPMLTAMLKIEVDDKDSNGTVIGKKVANKKIFIGTLHKINLMIHIVNYIGMKRNMEKIRQSKSWMRFKRIYKLFIGRNCFRKRKFKLFS